MKTIGLNYSLNPDFASEILNKEARDYANLNYTLLTFEDGSNFYLSSSQVYLGSKLEYELKENEVIIGLTLYNKLFKTSYTTFSLLWHFYIAHVSRGASQVVLW